MKAKLEQQFEKIAEKAIAEAEAVDCDFTDFVEGLDTIHVMVRDRLMLAKDEQDTMSP